MSASVGVAAIVLDCEEGEVMRAALEGFTLGSVQYPHVRLWFISCFTSD